MSDSNEPTESPEDINTVVKSLLPDKVYTVLKWIVILVMPAISTLYATLSTIWGWPHATEIVLTVNAVTLFMGILIGVSSKSYSGDGQLVTTDSGYKLVLNADPDELAAKSSITFQVVK